MKKLLCFLLLATPCFAQQAQRNATFDKIIVRSTSVFTGLITGTYPGVFTNTQNNENVTVGVNGTTPSAEWAFNYGSSRTTDGISSAILNPAGAGTFATQALAGYVRQRAGNSNSALGVYGQCIADTSNNQTCTGVGAVGSDAVGVPSNAIYGMQATVNALNAGSTVRGLAISSSFGAQPAGGYGIEIAPPAQIGACTTCAWTHGIRFDQAATTSTTTNGAAIFFAPVASGSAQNSQGLTFNLTDASNLAQYVFLNALANGNFNITTTKASTGLSINGGTGLQTTNQTGTGNLVLSTTPTISSPVINGTPSGTGIGTLTLKKGSGGGNYTTASTTYVVADSINLCFTVTIPTGWKLSISASGALGTLTGAVLANYALTDNAACSTANSGILVEGTETGTAAGVQEPFSMNWVINGDGNAHNIALQYKTSNGADSATLLNASATQLPTMVFTLMPSN